MYCSCGNLAVRLASSQPFNVWPSIGLQTAKRLRALVCMRGRIQAYLTPLHSQQQQSCSVQHKCDGECEWAARDGGVSGSFICHRAGRRARTACHSLVSCLFLLARERGEVGGLGAFTCSHSHSHTVRLCAPVTHPNALRLGSLCRFRFSFSSAVNLHSKGWRESREQLSDVGGAHAPTRLFSK